AGDVHLPILAAAADIPHPISTTRARRPAVLFALTRARTLLARSSPGPRHAGPRWSRRTPNRRYTRIVRSARARARKPGRCSKKGHEARSAAGETHTDPYSPCLERPHH